MSGGALTGGGKLRTVKSCHVAVGRQIPGVEVRLQVPCDGRKMGLEGAKKDLLDRRAGALRHLLSGVSDLVGDRQYEGQGVILLEPSYPGSAREGLRKRVLAALIASLSLLDRSRL